MLESFPLSSYLLLVDHTARFFRNGKARMDNGVKEIFERLGTSQEYWPIILKGPFTKDAQKQIAPWTLLRWQAG